MDTLIGFITDLTAEKRGPAKRYRRFNFNTLNQQDISGWVFSTIDIEDTVSGKILLEAAKNNSAVQIYGKLTQEQGDKQILKISINNKYEQCVKWASTSIPKQNHLVTSTLIIDALNLTTPSRLEALVIDQLDEATCLHNDCERKYKIYIIGDASGTSPIVVYDDLINIIHISETYVFGQIKTKRIHNNTILYTSSKSTIEQTNTIVTPNLINLDQSMSMNLLDIQEIETNLEEIIDHKIELLCSTCKQNLVSIPGKEHIGKCNNCSKYSLLKQNNFNTSATIQIDNQKQTFYPTKNLLQDFFKKENVDVDPSSENMCEYFLTNGPWLLMISHMQRQIIEIKKTKTN